MLKSDEKWFERPDYYQNLFLAKVINLAIQKKMSILSQFMLYKGENQKISYQYFYIYFFNKL